MTIGDEINELEGVEYIDSIPKRKTVMTGVIKRSKGHEKRIFKYDEDVIYNTQRKQERQVREIHQSRY